MNKEEKVNSTKDGYMDEEKKENLKKMGRKIAEDVLKRVDLKLEYKISEEENDKIAAVLEELMNQENVPVSDRRLLSFYAGENVGTILFELAEKENLNLKL